MQTLANFTLSVALKLSLVDQFGHFQVGLHGFHCHVQLAAIKSVTREQACILNVQMRIYIYPKIRWVPSSMVCAFHPTTFFSIRCTYLVAPLAPLARLARQWMKRMKN